MTPAILGGINQPAMFLYVFPPNEPASISSWVGEKLVENEMAVPILSHPGNAEDVIQKCEAWTGQFVLFFGGFTQLSWMFDTAEKVARWKALSRPRVCVATEAVFLDPPQHGSFPERFSQSLPAMTHIVGLNAGPQWDFENLAIKATGLPFLQMGALPFCGDRFEKALKGRVFDRMRRFAFIGTNHGFQRQAMLRALQEHDLVDVITVPKEEPMMLCEAYSRYAGVIELRSNHGVECWVLPRTLEALACGCCVLDLQGIEKEDAPDAVRIASCFDWSQAGGLAAAQKGFYGNCQAVPFYRKIERWITA